MVLNILWGEFLLFEKETESEAFQWKTLSSFVGFAFPFLKCCVAMRETWRPVQMTTKQTGTSALLWRMVTSSRWESLWCVPQRFLLLTAFFVSCSVTGPWAVFVVSHDACRLSNVAVVKMCGSWCIEFEGFLCFVGFPSFHSWTVCAGIVVDFGLVVFILVCWNRLCDDNAGRFRVMISLHGGLRWAILSVFML